MFELETEVTTWRGRLERSSSLSPREVDELEDHLRARFDLERELTPERSPAQVFSIVCDELGESAALAKEFVKAGRPRWRPLLLAGWVLFAASFFLPLHRTVWMGSPKADLAMFSEVGYEFLWMVMTGGGLAMTAVSIPAVLLANLPMAMTLPALFGSRRPTRRRLRRVLGVMGVLGVGLVINNLFRPTILYGIGGGPIAFHYEGLGCWLWAGSFALAATALWLRDRNWAPSKPEESVGYPMA
ncbi:hypothetical protein [Candidatus Palauibacter sp.]|uniref:hypothetical protein n=1 Tax=Candidatus Palauibacter sp. TaxID=3101350 RepID=UPI003B5B071D